MLISVCMIVWNEGEILARALGSIAALADQIVVVDTGSTDNTHNVAREYGALIITGADRMHKAQSRNLAMEAAEGDWVVILDADERVADPSGLRELLTWTKAQAVYIKLAYVDEDGNHTLSYSQMRCWRRGTYQYKYRAHELPVPVDGWGELAHTEFVWEHRPPPDRIWKSQYTLDRLLLDVKENPGDARPLYYLGRQYMYRKEWAEALVQLKQYNQYHGRDEADAWQCISQCHNGLGDKQERIKALYQACAVQPQRREWWCELASIYHQDGKDHIAAGLLKMALEQPMPAKTYVRHYWYGQAIYDLLARCLYKLGRYEEGITYARHAISLDPDDARLKTNLLWFESNLGDMDAFYTLYGPDIHAGCARHKAIADLCEGDRVLDWGCGTGDLLLLLQESGKYTELGGIDPSQVALDMAHDRGIEAKLSTTARFRIGCWDTVVSSQVLEHVDDGAAFIEQLGYHVRPGGKLIVSVPHNGRIPAPDHKREYSVESLTELLSVVGEPVLHSWSGERDRILMSVQKSG